MKCFVTGASGFVGSNLVAELLRAGHEVKALCRKNSLRLGLDGLDCEIVEGDIRNRPGLERALRGSEWCFHTAASYHLWLRDYAPMYEDNVEGTRNVLNAARMAGCSRVVYTSTVGCIGLPQDGKNPVQPTDETAPVSESQMSNHYKRSKWKAEGVALNMAQQGVPVVIVNPSAPIGPRDAKPTPTGQVIVDLLSGRMPAFLDTGLNWVHVRDVACGHILAASKGRIGERYILGNAQGNWSMGETLKLIAEIGGSKAPLFRIPYALAYAAALCNESLSWLTGTPPRAPLAGVKMARYKMYFNPAKAIQELGMPQTSPRQAFEDAIAWFSTNGYLSKPQRR
ncbi:MAG: NAD-dependent epimerase/dehydratase family protein [Verrucomicrobia bacterium]|nr:NAD-dependent epimerase/dehydratase family protein [Verrucomicrobiota bacterium]